MLANPPTIWTIGHSTRSIGEFAELLKQHGITTLVDVRHFPGSRRLPHFNKDALSTSLADAGIRYIHIVDLGGRRKPRPDSHNLRWENPSFRGYADYMETQPFRDAIDRLLHVAASAPTAIMCSEAVWWRCHRSMIADYLKSIGIHVLHITGPGEPKEHPYTQPAQLIDGRLSYHTGLFSHQPETEHHPNSASNESTND